jgi:hypothetical protein
MFESIFIFCYVYVSRVFRVLLLFLPVLSIYSYRIRFDPWTLVCGNNFLS